MGVAYDTEQWGVSEHPSDRFSNVCFFRSLLRAVLRSLSPNFPSKRRAIARERDRKGNITNCAAFFAYVCVPRMVMREEALLRAPDDN